MEQHSCKQQPSAEPKLCGNNCGFWGNPATMGLCSKCYQETAHGKNPQEASPTSLQPPVAAIVQAAAQPGPVPDVPSVAPRAAVAAAAAEAAAAPAPTAATPAAPADEQPPAPVQANRNRCFSCNKKVGLLGFECRCGYVFCSGHRHAQDHTCTFDYTTFDRERLAKANPLVAASKLDKL